MFFRSFLPLTILLLTACGKEPKPYTPAECVLAREFDATCARLSTPLNSADADMPNRENVIDAELLYIVNQRDTLRVDPGQRTWSCSPGSWNNWTHTAGFEPPLTTCLAKR